MIDTSAYEQAVYQYKLDTITLELCRKQMLDYPGKDARRQFEKALSILKASHQRMNKLETKIAFDALTAAHARLGLEKPKEDDDNA